MSYPAGEPLTSKITKAVVTYLNDCIVGHREPWDEGGLYNAVEEAFASDSHNPPDARVRELEAENARLREAIDQACYALDPNQGERPSPMLAYEWLRTTFPADHPNYVAREALEAGER